MEIQATIIADSISPTYKRITTLEVKFPKDFLAEFNTHRVFSRNFSSSRAVPTTKLVSQDSFTPLYWGKNQPGMSAQNEEIDNPEEAARIWNEAIEYCKEVSSKLSALGLHKQWANRVNDWHTMAQGIVTSTEWDNFFRLRCHPSAQPEMQELAGKMREAIFNSTPTQLEHGDWHLPYIKKEDKKIAMDHSDITWFLQKISAARCCRVSYLNHTGKKTTIEEDLALFEKLATGGHMSPLEHQATPDALIQKFTGQHDEWETPGLHGNFSGWRQYRKIWEFHHPIITE